MSGNDVIVRRDPVITVDAVLTAVFTVSAVIATVVFAQPWKTVAVVVSLVCFTVGVVAFLWGYWTAVQRSRTDNIAVASLYFLVDGAAPKPVARFLNLLLAVQVTVGVATASVRSSTDGKPGSTLAFGILVPMMGLGLNGLWGALHGTFGPRLRPQENGVPPRDPVNGQDG